MRLSSISRQVTLGRVQAVGQQGGSDVTSALRQRTGYSYRRYASVVALCLAPLGITVARQSTRTPFAEARTGCGVERGRGGGCGHSEPSRQVLSRCSLLLVGQTSGPTAVLLSLCASEVRVVSAASQMAPTRWHGDVSSEPGRSVGRRTNKNRRQPRRRRPCHCRRRRFAPVAR